MKKTFNRVLAAAMAVPMMLTQGVMSTVSAEDTGAKALTVNSFTAIPYDMEESQWNTALYNVVLSMEGTSKEIAAADFINLIPQTNAYGVMLAEILTGAPNPVMTVNGGVVTIAGTADLSSYADAKIYSKVNAAAGTELNMTAFNKTVEYSATVDANVLTGGKTLDFDYTVVIDGTEINNYNASAYFKGLADNLAAEVSSQIGVTADIEEAMTVEIIDKIEKAEDWFDRAVALERTGSYKTADEMMAAISKFVDNRVNVYDFPASVDEAVARHGAGFNAAIDLISGVTASSGYVLEITAADVAEVAKSGSNFEVNVAGGTYDVSFQIPDAEAKEVEAWVNANAVADENGIVWVYESSYKLVEATVHADGIVSYNVTRKINKADSRFTTTTTTTTTTDSGVVTTTTTVDPDVSSTTTTTTTTGTGDPNTTTTTTTTTTIPEEFELASVELEAGVGYFFSHDENTFDLSKLVNSLTLVGTLDGETKTFPIAAQDYATYLTPAYATPADYFNSVEGLAYAAGELTLTFVKPEKMLAAADADLTVANQPTVYIGVKGDTDLNGKVEIADAQLILTYYAQNAAMMDITPLNEDADLAVLAYFLADVNTESTAGANTEEAEMEIADAQAILAYYAQNAAMMDPTWDAILGA